jgi:hypothetical protein
VGETSKIRYMNLKLIMYSAVFLISFYLLSCKQEDIDTTCSSDVVRYITSNNVTVHLKYDSIGRLVSLEPIDTTKDFVFRDIVIEKKAELIYELPSLPVKVILSPQSYIDLIYDNGYLKEKTKRNSPMLSGNKSGYISDAAGNTIARYRNDEIYLAFNDRIEFEYNGSRDILKANEFIRDINYPGPRLWTSYSYTYDDKINPLFSTLRWLTCREDAIMLSYHNCTSINVDLAIRLHTPIGLNENVVKYDNKGRLIYFKGAFENEDLTFSYCD